MTTENHQYEVIVIGAGPGGYAAAFRASDLGKNVLLIDKNDELGGVCLNRGCIPSKALLHVAKVIEESREISSAGVKFGSPEINLTKVRSWKNKVVTRLNRGIAHLAKTRKVAVIRGEARFLSDRELQIITSEGQKAVTFDHCIIATGSSPAMIPGIPTDHPAVMNSTGALELEDIPRRLLIVGGGYIGLELGTVYHALGSEITVVEFMDTLLPGADKDLVTPLYTRLNRKFKKILLNTRVQSVEPDGDTLNVHVSTGDKQTTITVDKVLISVGRKPNTASLGLKKAGIQLNEKGFIPVNELQQTRIPHIFAIGDVAGNPMLAHKATYEGKVAAEVISGEKSANDARAIPAVIFTDPEIAWAGLTETQAMEQNIPYEKGEFPWAASGRALSMGRNDGKTKILFDPASRHVLGVGIVGPNAGELIAEGVLAIEMGADADDLGMTIHPHPTLSETLANSAEAFTGTITDLYIPKNKN